jgi:hypothetical protein
MPARKNKGAGTKRAIRKAHKHETKAFLANIHPHRRVEGIEGNSGGRLRHKDKVAFQKMHAYAGKHKPLKRVAHEAPKKRRTTKKRRS